MKSTLKVALLATVLMATPALASDMNKDSNVKYNSQHVAVDADGKPMMKHHSMHHRGQKFNDQRPAASLDDADRMNNSDSRMNRERDRSGESRWMGMNYNTRGMKAGTDSDMNNRSQHSFIFGNSESHVTKH